MLEDNLEHLSPEKLTGLETGTYCFLINSELSEAISKRFPKLRVFKPAENSLYECDLSSVVQNCPELTELRLSIVRIHSDILSLIGMHSHLLESLEIDIVFDLSSEMLCGLAKGCKMLRQLHLSIHSSADGDDLSVGFSAIAKHFSQLNDLYLRGDSMTDVVLGALSMYCRNLTILFIGSKSITDEGMVPLIEKAGATLQSLNIMNEENVSDITLLTIAKHCSELRIFKSYSSILTEYCVMLLYDKCPKLTELSVANCSVSTLLHITRGCREITLSGGCSMYIFEINRVGGEVTVYTDVIQGYTADCLRTIALLNPQLESLNLSTQTVSSGVMAYIKSVCPELQQFMFT